MDPGDHVHFPELMKFDEAIIPISISLPYREELQYIQTNAHPLSFEAKKRIELHRTGKSAVRRSTFYSEEYATSLLGASELRP